MINAKIAFENLQDLTQTALDLKIPLEALRCAKSNDSKVYEEILDAILNLIAKKYKRELNKKIPLKNRKIALQTFLCLFPNPFILKSATKNYHILLDGSRRLLHILVWLLLTEVDMFNQLDPKAADKLMQAKQIEKGLNLSNKFQKKDSKNNFTIENSEMSTFELKHLLDKKLEKVKALENLKNKKVAKLESQTKIKNSLGYARALKSTKLFNQIMEEKEVALNALERLGQPKKFKTRKVIAEWTEYTKSEDKKENSEMTNYTEIEDQEEAEDFSLKILNRKTLSLKELLIEIKAELRAMKKHTEQVQNFSEFWQRATSQVLGNCEEFNLAISKEIPRLNKELKPIFYIWEENELSEPDLIELVLEIICPQEEIKKLNEESEKLDAGVDEKLSAEFLAEWKNIFEDFKKFLEENGIGTI